MDLRPRPEVGRNSPVAIMIAILALVSILGLVYQRHEAIANSREIDQVVDQFTVEACLADPDAC